MIDIERYKRVYGDGELKMEGRLIILPLWFIRVALDQTGLKSKKKRHVRKRLKSFTTECILRGIKAE